MRCKDGSQVRRYPYKRSHLVALRPTKISAERPAIDVVDFLLAMEECTGRDAIKMLRERGKP
jgi:hypothetical protein